jgi:hypothetical protein
MRDAQARVEWANDSVAKFEKGVGNSDDCAAAILKAREACDAAEAAVITAQHRQRLAAMRSECDNLAQNLVTAQARFQRKATATSERDQLLRNRSVPGNEQAFENIGHTAVGNAYLDKERDSLRHTSREVSRMAEESTAVLDALRAQRRRMEGTRGKLEGVLQGLGVSDQAIRQIRSMNSTDALIVSLGTAAIVLLMLYLWFA